MAPAVRGGRQSRHSREGCLARSGSNMRGSAERSCRSWTARSGHRKAADSTQANLPGDAAGSNDRARPPAALPPPSRSLWRLAPRCWPCWGGGPRGRERVKRGSRSTRIIRNYNVMQLLRVRSHCLGDSETCGVPQEDARNEPGEIETAGDRPAVIRVARRSQQRAGE